MKIHSVNGNSKHELSFLTGIVVPLGALYTKNCTAIGEFPALEQLVPFCKAAGIGIIQLLPVNDTGTQSSPYSGLSAFALHPIYISLKVIPGFNSIYKSDKEFTEKYEKFIKNNPSSCRYDYKTILNEKIDLLQMMYRASGIPEQTELSENFATWIKRNPWIENYAVFKQLKWKYMQASWKTWPLADRFITAAEIQKKWNDPVSKKTHLFYAWVQFQAHTQFKKAFTSVKKAGILLKGDIPIMMNEDSCDAWAQPDIFNHRLRAGSPPDNENPLGQNWGFPIYNWDYLKQTNYKWWKERLKSMSQYYDAYRLDHILGFFRIWAVPEAETSAYMGHPEPYVPLTCKELQAVGFDDSRIHWLSEPHIPTASIEDITWNRDTAHRILSLFAEKIGDEELWNFKPTIKGDSQLFSENLESFCTQETAERIKRKLAEYWRNRSLIKIEKDRFVPVWTYEDSNSWESLNNDERNRLEKLFEIKKRKQDTIWKQQAENILTILAQSTTMIPCGEDLGAGLPYMTEILCKAGILGLRVVRWSRNWQTSEQPFIPFESYTPLSVTTTSVHDSPTLRQWWNTEKNAVNLFVKTFFTASDEANPTSSAVTATDDFSPAIEKNILMQAAKSASIWCIHPIQDFLYLNQKYWQQEAEQERINIPGTVSAFNWTYRMPVSVENLAADTTLINDIREISDKHTKRSNA